MHLAASVIRWLTLPMPYRLRERKFTNGILKGQSHEQCGRSWSIYGIHVNYEPHFFKFSDRPFKSCGAIPPLKLHFPLGQSLQKHAKKVLKCVYPGAPTTSHSLQTTIRTV
jgi:hypothetical protein